MNAIDLRDHLGAALLDLKAGSLKPDKAVAMAHLAGQMIASAKAQIAYHALRGERPLIEFLDAGDVEVVEVVVEPAALTAAASAPEPAPMLAAPAASTPTSTPSPPPPSKDERKLDRNAPAIVPENVKTTIAKTPKGRYEADDSGGPFSALRIGEYMAKGLTAPRVTPADLEANIRNAYYFTALQGAMYPDGQGEREPVDAQALGLLTFCVLVLRNGFTVTGESACASPENFDADVGRKIARANAVNKVWPLMGYVLKERLANGWYEQA